MPHPATAQTILTAAQLLYTEQTAPFPRAPNQRSSCSSKATRAPPLMRGVAAAFVLHCMCASIVGEHQWSNNARGVVDRCALDRQWYRLEPEVRATCAQGELSLHRNMSELVYLLAPRLIVLVGTGREGLLDCGVKLVAAAVGAKVVNVPSLALYQENREGRRVDMLVLDVTRLHEDTIMSEASGWMAEFTYGKGAFILVGTNAVTNANGSGIQSQVSSNAAAFIMEVLYGLVFYCRCCVQILSFRD
jgi:hypothetical protein